MRLRLWPKVTGGAGCFWMKQPLREKPRRTGGASFSGQLGGPPEVLAPLVGEMMGVVTAPIEYEDDGRRHRVRIGAFAEIEILDFVPPQTPEGEVSKVTGVFHPANSTLTMAQATASRVSAFGLEFSNVGKNGHSAPF